MAPARRSRKTAVISDDEDTEDILSDDAVKRPKHPASSPKVSKHTKRNEKKRASTKTSPQKKAGPVASGAAKSKGTLFSFFNAATQKQQGTPRPSTPPKTTQEKTVDLLDSIEDGDGEVDIVTGSRTVLAARKRKQDDTAHLFDPQAYGSAAGSQKFRKAVGGAKLAASEGESDRRPWMERFAPMNIDELAVHNKKVKDVRALLEDAMSPQARPRLLVLKGPAGTGKTTTVQLLAKAMDLDLKEWRNPINVDIGSESFISTSSQFEDFVLRSSKFSGLDLTSDLHTAPRTRAPDSSDSNNQHILLVEEFPVSLTRSSPILQAFRTTIQSYLAIPNRSSSPAAPIVLILSETLLSSSTSSPDTLTPHRLLGPNILTHPLTAVVEFNPIAPTLLTRALTLIATKESRVSGRRRTPGPAVLTHLAEMGDIRSAASALEFLCLKGDVDGDWGAKVSFGKAKGLAKGSATDSSLTDRERESLKLVGGREGALGLWHAVGKVVYNKRLERPRSSRSEEQRPGSAQTAHATSNKGTRTASTNMSLSTTLLARPQHLMPNAPRPPHLQHLDRPKAPENDPDTLLLELGTDISTFIAALHENIIPSCATSSSDTTLDSLDACLSVLSDADCLSIDRYSGGGGYGGGTAAEGLRQEEISFHAAVRGSVFWLPYPVKREAGHSEQRQRRGNVMAWPQSLRLWRGKEEVEDLLELVADEYGRTLRGSVGIDGLEETSGRAGDAVGGGVVVVVPSARSKGEVALELAPYLRLVHEGRRTIGSLRDRVRRATRFDTLHMQSLPSDGPGGEGDEEDEEGDDEASRGLKRERRTKTGKAIDGGLWSTGVEDDVMGLVLSEDDIVDD